MEKGYSINYTKLIELCNLKDENNISQCGATLSIDEINDFKEPKNILQQGINANVNIYSRGGCSVVELIYSIESSFEFKRIQSLFKQCVDYNDEKNVRILTLIIVPKIYEGCIFITMSDLVYFNTTITPKELKISAAFNNDATQVLTDDAVDIRELEAEVELELRHKEEELDSEIEELEKIYKEQNNRNVYEDNLQGTIGTVNFEYNENKEYGNNSLKSTLRRDSNYENYGKRYTNDVDDEDIVI